MRSVTFLKRIYNSKAMLYILAFVIPVLVFMGIMIKGEFYPFGDKTLFIMDMNNGAMQNYYNLRRIITGDESVFFNWSVSMGRNYIGIFLFFLISPLTLVTVLFPMRYFTMGIMAMLAAGVGCSGLTFAVYGRYLWCRQNRDNDKTLTLGRMFAILIPSTGYALISYNIVYTVMPTWTTGVIMLPLVLLGFEKILDGRKGLFAVISMAVLFITSYYMAYMIGIFTGLYVIMRFVTLIDKDNSIKDILVKILRFAASAVLALGIAAFAIVPAGYELLYGKLAAAEYLPDMNTNYENFTDVFGKFVRGTYDSITNSGLPSIYCGYIVIFFAVVFFAVKGIRIREKISALIIGIFILVSFWIIPLDRAWHVFHYPNWFPYRYAYVFGFLMCYMAVRALSVIVPALYNSEKVKKVIHVGHNVVITAISVVLVVVTAFDMEGNGLSMFKGLDEEFYYIRQDYYTSFLDRAVPVVDKMKEDDEWYRTTQRFEYSKNDSLLLGYRGMTHYSANYNVNVNNLTRNLGYSQTHYWNSGVGGTLLTDSLFGIKYVIENAQLPLPYDAVYTSDEGVTLWNNSDALAVAYAAPVTDRAPYTEGTDSMACENAYMQSLMGNDTEYFKPIEYEYNEESASHRTLAFTAVDDAPVYLQIPTDSLSGGEIMVNGVKVSDCFDDSHRPECVYYLGSFESGEVINVDISSAVDCNIYGIGLNRLDMNAVHRDFEYLNEHGIKIDRLTGNSISGTIDVGDNSSIVTSIPYEAGWTVTIDGKKQELTDYAGTFLMVENVSPGVHDIKLSFVPAGLIPGCIIGFVSIAILVGLAVLNKKNREDGSLEL